MHSCNNNMQLEIFFCLEIVFDDKILTSTYHYILQSPNVLRVLLLHDDGKMQGGKPTSNSGGIIISGEKNFELNYMAKCALSSDFFSFLDREIGNMVNELHFLTYK